MMDDLDRLQAALRHAPAPDADAKAAAIALALKNFDALQGSPAAARPMSDRPEPAGFLDGVRNMLKTYRTTRILAVTTSVAAICAGLVVVLPMTGRPPRLLPEPVVVQTEPATPLAETGVQAPVDGGLSRQGTNALAPVALAPVALAPVAPPQALREPMADTAPAPSPMVESGAAMPSAKMAPDAFPDAEPAPVIVGMAAPEMAAMPPQGTETFANAPGNPVKVTSQDPVSTFSIDVDTASYAIVRSSLNGGYLPDPAAVRIEEMLNYFPYAYPGPAAGDAPFRPSVTVMPTPWNPGTQLVRIGLQGRLPALDDRPALNLVFLIDTSGSMEDANKLPLLKQSLRLMLAELRPEDQVAIVAYAGSAGEVLPPTRAENADAILSALDRLGAGGSTAGAEGLTLAYQLARKMAAAGEVSRVLLATDGDFNVGIDDPEALTKYIATQRDTGVYLSVLGFGRGNLDDATMQALAQNGNGTAAYIDTLNEARKVLVDQLTGALFPIADDVKIQVEWNPATVAEYRLIGYQTRALRREDFNNDTVDAGEIGAGTAVTALYEITAPGSPALRNDPLRYGPPPAAPATGELGFLRLRYKAPGETVSALIETPIPPGSIEPDADARFAAAIAGFGQLLTGATYLGDWGWDQAIALALGARGDDPFGYRIEAVSLMRLAQSLSAN